MIRRILRHFRNPPLDPYRRRIKDLLQPILPENPVIVEAGSHFGEDTLWLARYWPRGLVHAFEPVPELFALTERHTSWIRNVRRYPFAQMGIDDHARNGERGVGIAAEEAAVLNEVRLGSERHV